MSQKVREITITVVALEEDAEQVRESLDLWFDGHDVALICETVASRVSAPRPPTPHERAVFMLDE